MLLHNYQDHLVVFYCYIGSVLWTGKYSPVLFSASSVREFNTAWAKPFPELSLFWPGTYILYRSLILTCLIQLFGIFKPGWNHVYAKITWSKITLYMVFELNFTFTIFRGKFMVLKYFDDPDLTSNVLKR